MSWKFNDCGIVSIATLDALALAFSAPAQVQAPLWRGVDLLAVDCRLPDTAAVGCSDVVAAVRRDAPMPVRAWHAADAERRDTIILDVRVADDADGPALTLSARRAVVVDEAEGAMLPRRFAWASNASAAACATMLAQALDRTLPWRAGARSRRHMPNFQGRQS